MKKIYVMLIILILNTTVFSMISNPMSLYQNMRLDGKIKYEIFEEALTGYNKIKNKKNKDVIAIIDYTKPSTEKRFFVLDLKNQKVLFETLVAHGKNSGTFQTISFSNIPNSYQTALGFFLTDTTYNGDFGYSLKLLGLEEGFNSNADRRKIVIHGASYVSESFIKQFGFLGRTLGCPAVPVEYSQKIIDTIKNGTVVFVIGNDQNYFKFSKILNS